MWWNFVARDNDEIVAAREQWAAGSTFGDVAGFDGYRLPAPDLPAGRLKPGGATRRVDPTRPDRPRPHPPCRGGWGAPVRRPRRPVPPRRSW